MSEPTIVCVLGMHRSGTSLVSRLLNVLGLDLGPEDHLMRPSSANPTGHWESLPISELNEEILERLGGNWAKPPKLTPGWERRPELAELRRQAREVIEADFSGSDLWGFKDPRASLTAPFWQRILGPMRYVICLRNPLDVAASLKAREAEPLGFQQGIGLWLTYVRASLAATAGRPRELVFYEDLMADPEPLLGRLARFIGTDRSDTAEMEARLAIRVAMSEGLWHHRTTIANVVDAGRLSFPAKALYLALRLSVAGAEAVPGEALDLLGAYAEDAGDQLARLESARAELGTVRKRSRNLEQRLAERDAELAERDAELAERDAALGAGQAELDEARRQSRNVEDDRSTLAQRLLEREAELEANRSELEHLREQSRSLEGERAGPGAPAVGEQAPAPAAPPSGDERLAGEIRARAREVIPSGATVLVAGKGDDALLALDGSRGWHFPLGTDGRYLGYHPACDTAVIAQLEALRARGADHLVLPTTTLWWLEHYQGLRRHLEARYVRLLADEQCAIYRLRGGERGHASEPIAMLERTVASLRTHFGREPSILDWRTDLPISDQLPELPVFIPPDEEATLPYLDGTVDVVVLASTDAARIAEAHRVAASAVIRVDPSSPEEAELEWLAGGDSAGWGEDVSVTLIPDADGPAWDATVAAFAETLNDGFGGELRVIGQPATLGRASERAAAAGVRVRPVEVRAGASFAERAHLARKTAEQSVQVLVTAPAVPLPDWLPSVLALFRPDRDAGVVGTRILSGEGVLREAGGMLAAGGMRRRRGEGDHDPDRPEYGFVRRVDFCSPPVLATRRALFERLVGGQDERYAGPAEALVDFSLRAGQAGAPVYYQPQARVVSIDQPPASVAINEEGGR